MFIKSEQIGPRDNLNEPRIRISEPLSNRRVRLRAVSTSASVAGSLSCPTWVLGMELLLAGGKASVPVLLLLLFNIGAVRTQWGRHPRGNREEQLGGKSRARRPEAPVTGGRTVCASLDALAPPPPRPSRLSKLALSCVKFPHPSCL